MKVELIDSMGSDLSVVNAARVSFAKQHNKMEENDEGLIKYLARHNHWTPFGHCSVSFRIKAPIFVARQLGKHQVGLVWNEVSRRYVDDEPEFYEPEVWRGRANNIKQGSSSDAVNEPLHKRMWPHDCRTTSQAYQRYLEYALDLYQALLDNDTCPEQARMVLPQSMYTEWVWTGSLMAFARVCKLRMDPHTQQETRSIAYAIDSVMHALFPVSWKALING